MISKDREINIEEIVTCLCVWLSDHRNVEMFVPKLLQTNWATRVLARKVAIWGKVEGGSECTRIEHSVYTTYMQEKSKLLIFNRGGHFIVTLLTWFFPWYGAAQWNIHIRHLKESFRDSSDFQAVVHLQKFNNDYYRQDSKNTQVSFCPVSLCPFLWVCIAISHSWPRDTTSDRAVAW